MGYFLAPVQRADYMDALSQAGGANVLETPAAPGDVFVQGLARPKATQKRSGNIAASVADAWAMIAGR